MPFVKDLDVSLRAYVPAFDVLGTATPEQVTLTNIDDIRSVTRLTWDPAVEPQYRRIDLTEGDDSMGRMETFEEIPGRHSITRGKGGPILGSATGSYHTFSNADLFGIGAAIGTAALEMGREVRCLSAGEIAGGKRVFLLFDLGVTEIPGDTSPHVRYMTLLSSHSGNGAIKALGTNMRWRCTNALRATEIEAAKNAAAFSFRHTSRAALRLADARKAITAAMLQHDVIEERTADMIATAAQPGRVSEYLAQFALAHVVLKADPAREHVAALSVPRQKAIADVEQELTGILGSPTCDGIRDSAYGAFAAVTEYLDNRRKAESHDTRFDRTMVNTERSKVLGYRLARKMFG